MTTELERIKAENPHSNVYEEDGKIIVSGAAAMASHGGINANPTRSALLQQAAEWAVMQALAEGYSIEDSTAILAYKRWARAYVLAHAGEKIDVPERPQPKAKM